MRRAVALLDAVGAYEDVRARITPAGAAAGPRAARSEDMPEFRAWMRRRIDGGDPRRVTAAAGVAVRSGLVDEALAAYAHLNDAGYALMSPGAMGTFPGPLVSLLEERDASTRPSTNSCPPEATFTTHPGTRRRRF
jgi:hypothetical protein